MAYDGGLMLQEHWAPAECGIVSPEQFWAEASSCLGDSSFSSASGLEVFGSDLHLRMARITEEMASLRGAIRGTIHKLEAQQEQAGEEIARLRSGLLDVLTPDVVQRTERVRRLSKRLDMLEKGFGNEQAECMRVLEAVLATVERSGAAAGRVGRPAQDASRASPSRKGRAVGTPQAEGPGSRSGQKAATSNGMVEPRGSDLATGAVRMVTASEPSLLPPTLTRSASMPSAVTQPTEMRDVATPSAIAQSISGESPTGASGRAAEEQVDEQADNHEQQAEQKPPVEAEREPDEVAPGKEADAKWPAQIVSKSGATDQVMSKSGATDQVYTLDAIGRTSPSRMPWTWPYRLSREEELSASQARARIEEARADAERLAEELQEARRLAAIASQAAEAATKSVEALRSPLPSSEKSQPPRSPLPSSEKGQSQRQILFPVERQQDSSSPTHEAHSPTSVRSAVAQPDQPPAPGESSAPARRTPLSRQRPTNLSELSGVAEFEIIVDKSSGLRLGCDVDVDSGNGAALRIRRLDGGLLEKWNQDNPQQVVEAGDLMIKVNGIDGDAQRMLRECATQKHVLRIFVRKGTSDTTGRQGISDAAAAPAPEASGTDSDSAGENFRSSGGGRAGNTSRPSDDGDAVGSHSGSSLEREAGSVQRVEQPNSTGAGGRKEDDGSSSTSSSSSNASEREVDVRQANIGPGQRGEDKEEEEDEEESDTSDS